MEPREVAQEAITESQCSDRIVHLPYSAAIAEELLALADDSADTDSETEYWGRDDHGAWRVHMDHA